MPGILIGYSARMGRMRAKTLVALLAAVSVAAIAASLTLGSSGLDAPWQRLAEGDPLVRTSGSPSTRRCQGASSPELPSVSEAAIAATETAASSATRDFALILPMRAL